MSRDEESSGPADDFDLEVRIVCQRPPDDGNELSIALYALDFRSAGVLRHISFYSVTEFPRTASKGIGRYERPGVADEVLAHVVAPHVSACDRSKSVEIREGAS